MDRTEIVSPPECSPRVDPGPPLCPFFLSCLRVGFSASLLWGQATLRVAFQFLDEIPSSQRASGVGTAPNRPQFGFRFSRPQELLPTGLAPVLAPSHPFQPSRRFGPPAVSGSAGPGPIRHPHHQPRARRIQLRAQINHPRESVARMNCPPFPRWAFS